MKEHKILLNVTAPPFMDSERVIYLVSKLIDAGSAFANLALRDEDETNEDAKDAALLLFDELQLLENQEQAGSERQCEACQTKWKYNDEEGRCSLFALNGSKYCSFHQGW